MVFVFVVLQTCKFGYVDAIDTRLDPACQNKDWESQISGEGCQHAVNLGRLAFTHIYYDQPLNRQSV